MKQTVYVHKGVAMHVGIYVYTRGSRSPPPVRGTPRDHMCNCAYAEERGVLYRAPCPHENPWDWIQDVYKRRQMPVE